MTIEHSEFVKNAYSQFLIEISLKYGTLCPRCGGCGSEPAYGGTDFSLSQDCKECKSYGWVHIRGLPPSVIHMLKKHFPDLQSEKDDDSSTIPLKS